MQEREEKSWRERETEDEDGAGVGGRQRWSQEGSVMLMVSVLRSFDLGVLFADEDDGWLVGFGGDGCRRRWCVGGGGGGGVEVGGGGGGVGDGGFGGGERVEQGQRMVDGSCGGIGFMVVVCGEPPLMAAEVYWRRKQGRRGSGSTRTHGS